MKKNAIIYWVSTAIIGLMMCFSAYSYFTAQQAIDGFKQIGFPDFFRIELGVAKIIGAIVLLVPQFPSKLKEWAYAGFAIVFISASIAHYNIGDTAAHIATPLVFLALLLISNLYLYKKDQ
jgi:VIT1/CCC1 family predicted Fe2+/Mn2+ transporter